MISPIQQKVTHFKAQACPAPWCCALELWVPAPWSLVFPPCAGNLSFPATSIISWMARKIHRIPAQQWEFHPFLTQLALSQQFPSFLLTLESVPWISKGRSFSLLPQGPTDLCFKLSKPMFPAPGMFAPGFPHREETQCPEEMGRHILHRDPGSCKSCLSAWSGCNFGVIYSDYSFNLNLNWMLQVAQPVLLRLEHPHWVRPVYKSSELNIFIGSCHAFFSWVQTLAIYYAAPFPSWGRNQPFVSAWNQQHVHSPH